MQQKHCNTTLQHGTATNDTLQHRVRSPIDLTSSTCNNDTATRHCNTVLLQRHCNKQHAATQSEEPCRSDLHHMQQRHCNNDTATRHCNTTLQHDTATRHYNNNTLQHRVRNPVHLTSIQQRYCNTTLQHGTATRHCNRQHAATQSKEPYRSDLHGGGGKIK